MPGVSFTPTQLSACCGSVAWVQQMVGRQPFADIAAVHSAADEIWWSLTQTDWLEAFAAHPRIGQNSNSAWSAQEQSGMRLASEDTAVKLARLNDGYYSKFGFIFIVCASGKSASAMLRILEDRIQHKPEDEIRIAAAEQAKITRLRLDRVVAG